ncbi:MAG: glucosamine-6-phosphate deaminase [Oscillospiraceae bacterium]|jgi:glucosamine-6-phosphate deaminase|nr:glucosamine-6-phosphate deaminase [Oscillospiraceae bacterium]
MNVHILKTQEEIAAVAADFFCEVLKKKPNAVLGLATGGTPIPTYEELARRAAAGKVDFSATQTFNLDEYCGLSPKNDQSYRYFMQEQLFNKVGIRPDHVYFFDGLAQDTLAECARYEAELAAFGGVDLQLLGIGRNGHIGFNEPAEKMHAHCFRVELTQDTIQANRRFFAQEDEMPRCALTMGMGTILTAKKILLIATGEDKATAVYGMLRGEISGQCPASFLRTHGNVIALLDESAARLL